MPLNNGAKAANEHLIFVKNVPGYIETDELKRMYESYNPTSLKNVYPNSNVTTIVVGFRTKAEAARAQEETDQTRIANVILKVEMYNQRQSVRYLRDQGQASRPLGMAEQDEPGYFDEPAQEDAPVFTPPLEPYVARDPAAAPQGTTWADIAGNRAAPVKHTTKLEGTDSPATVPSTPNFTPRMPIAVPQKLPPGQPQPGSSPPPAAVSLGHSTPEALTIPPAVTDVSTDSGSEATDETDENEEHDRMISDIAIWQATAQWANETVGYQSPGQQVEPLDTTARIRQRHCRDCVFCQMRNRS
ncbi:uncharacterized protein J4E84_010657 [Alternaria hordeiaustralica]|uniref:uncharacterized protein n=1 Tax=Alternaria hordeiaustralica TaxID=1187925 RepID=UPI0020C4691B|nr:uncharacterized protein J4E84_010657 [Alternaria hordeiaustralica]KAI4674282.1 hypothetical protein J4E84_010657 [Alternaria hordeiaustralica]